MPFKINKFKFSLSYFSFVILCCLILTPFAHAGDIDFGKLWMQDRFVRMMAFSIGKSPQQQLAILDSALDMAKAMKTQPKKIVQVQSVKEFEKVRSQYFRSEGSLNDDAELIVSHVYPDDLIIQSQNPEVILHMNQISTAYNQELDKPMSFPPQKWWFSILTKLRLTQYRNVYFFDLLSEDSKDSERLMTGIKGLSEKIKLQKISEFSSQIKNQIESFDQNVLQVLDSESFSFSNPALARLLKVVIKSYFQNLSQDEKLELIFSILENPEDMTPIGVFKRVSRQAGPEFQKIFQFIGNDKGFSPELRETFKTFQEDLPASPKKEAEKIRKKLQNSKDFELLEFEMEAAQVGTMFELHFAKVRWPDGRIEEVAVRIMKFELREKIQRESLLMDRIAKELESDPEVSSTLGNMLRQINELKSLLNKELNVDATTTAQIKAEQLYKRDEVRLLPSGEEVLVSIRVPKILGRVDTDTIIMEKINGISSDELKEKHPDLLMASSEAWAKTWLDVALFGDGFMHADGHPGNIKNEILSPKHIRLWILDYGMTGQLTPRLQDRIALLALSNYAEIDSVLARTLIDLSITKNVITAQVLAERFSYERQRLKSLGASEEISIPHLILLSVKLGLSFEDDFNSMARGLVPTLQVLKSSGSRSTPGSLAREIVTKNPSRLFKFHNIPTLIYPHEIVALSASILPKVGQKFINDFDPSDIKKNLKSLVQWFSPFGSPASPKLAPTATGNSCREIF